MKDNEHKPLPSRRNRRAASLAPQEGKAHLLGVIFQKTDGHKRITKGEKFTLVGGNQETHEAITEGVVKTFEDLERKGRTLETADPKEIGELLQKNFPKIRP